MTNVTNDEDYKVICPVCDHVISDFEEGKSDPCEHVVLIYTGLLNGEFVYIGDNYNEIADGLIEIYEGQDGEDDKELDELMEEYIENNKGYEILTMTTSGLACGPCSSTEYIMVRTSTE